MSLDPPRRFDPDEPLVLDPDPVSQWLDWEEQANLVGFRTSTAPVATTVASSSDTAGLIVRRDGGRPSSTS